ncbi:hypothetical protein ACFXOQ_37220, partial [Streptomyces californicus]|uniref:hypothetical protein n=1 Tax=Streptomyces californicus TaxID=67351 RepID=UPI0036A13387
MAQGWFNHYDDPDEFWDEEPIVRPPKGNSSFHDSDYLCNEIAGASSEQNFQTGHSQQRAVTTPPHRDPIDVVDINRQQELFDQSVDKVMREVGKADTQAGRQEFTFSGD